MQQPAPVELNAFFMHVELTGHAVGVFAPVALVHWTASSSAAASASALIEFAFDFDFGNSVLILAAVEFASTCQPSEW